MPRYRVKTLLAFTALAAIALAFWQWSIAPHLAFRRISAGNLEVGFRYQECLWIQKPLESAAQHRWTPAYYWDDAYVVYKLPIMLLVAIFLVFVTGVWTIIFAWGRLFRVRKRKPRALSDVTLGSIPEDIKNRLPLVLLLNCRTP